MNKENVYIGEDGLEHCSVCREATERVVPEHVQMIFGMKKHPRQCVCVRERMEKECRERNEREHQREVEKNTAICFPERAMREWNFANDDGSNPYMKYAEQYVEHWDDVKRKGMGLLLWGDVGTGKSYMAACIANALLEQEKRVLMTNFTSISNGVFAATDKNDYIEFICGYELLILDDLGSERNSGFVVENVFSVLDRRVCSGKPMIITTNLTVKEMRETKNLDYKRIYDRVLGSCQPVCIKGESHRREKGNKNKKAFEQIFLEEKSE